MGGADLDCGDPRRRVRGLGPLYPSGQAARGRTSARAPFSILATPGGTRRRAVPRAKVETSWEPFGGCGDRSQAAVFGFDFGRQVAVAVFGAGDFGLELGFQGSLPEAVALAHQAAQEGAAEEPEAGHYRGRVAGQPEHPGSAWVVGGDQRLAGLDGDFVEELPAAQASRAHPRRNRSRPSRRRRRAAGRRL